MPKGGDKVLRDIFDKAIILPREGTVKIEINYIDDAQSENKLHARYFLTNKGGLRYDKGFATTSTPELVDISLLDKKLHLELYSLYIEEASDMKIQRTLVWENE